MVIWKDVNVIINQKIPCSVRRQHRFVHSKRIVKLHGDLPVCELVDTKEGTIAIREVVNTRGLAYGHRNKMKYRKTKKQKLYDLI